jgi:hypothetical protein
MCVAVIASSFGSQAERVTMPVVYTGMYKGERFNSFSHLIGAALALAGSVVLVTFAAIDGDTRRILSYSVYGLTLFLLYLVSTLYHVYGLLLGCKHSVLRRVGSTAHVYPASDMCIELSIRAMMGYSRASSQSLFRASRTWTFAGSAGAGSTCSPSFGLLGNRG